MKNIRKILLAILAISVAICGFTVVASASSDNSSLDILEYYEGNVYVNETFDGLTDASDAFADVSEYFVKGSYDREEVSDGVFCSKNFSTVHTGIYFSDTVPEGFGLNTSFWLYDASASQRFAIVLHTSDPGDAEGNSPIIVFMKDGSGVKIGKGDHEFFEGVSVLSTVEDFDIESQRFYGVKTFFEVDENSVSGMVVLTDADGLTLQSSLFSIEGYSVAGVSIATNAQSSALAENYIDYIEIYEGSFMRRLNENLSEIGDIIIDTASRVDAVGIGNISEELMSDVRDASKVISDYGYSTEEIEDSAKAEEIKAAIEKIYVVLADEYAEKFLEVAVFNSENAYFERKSSVDNASSYANMLQGVKDNYIDVWEQIDEDGIVTLALQAYYDELNALIDIENTTVAAIEVLDAIEAVEQANYATLKNAVEYFAENEICITYRAEGYDEARINNAVAKVAAIQDAYENLCDRAEAFLEYVAIAYDDLIVSGTVADFVTGYNAYVLATENYLNDETYEVNSVRYSEISQAVEEYDICSRYVKEISDVYAAFLSAVNDAYGSPSFNVKINSVEAVSQHYVTLKNNYMAYPGVSDAILKYEGIVEDIAAQRVLAEKYVKAVIAIADATNLEARKAAIAYAKSLDAGSDTSLQYSYLGISLLEANIMLSEQDTAIKYAEAVVKNYINSVSVISTYKTAQERRAGIILALANKAIAADVNPGDNPDAAGVEMANELLSKEIEKYNKDVENANKSFDEAEDLAAAIVCVTIPNAPAKEVVALVKKIYE